MDADYLEQASIYLKLWKLIDIHFPGHHWLELTDESEDDLKGEIEGVLEDLSRSSERNALRRDIEETLELVESWSGKDWSRSLRAQQMRTDMQSKALEAAGQIRQGDSVL